MKQGGQVRGPFKFDFIFIGFEEMGSGDVSCNSHPIDFIDTEMR